MLCLYLFDPNWTAGGTLPKIVKKAEKATKPLQIDEFLIVSTNFSAMQNTIGALRKAGRLESVDMALVAIARHLAQQVDEHPENASLWKEYRAAELALRAGVGNENDGLAELAKQFDTALRDQKN